MRERVTAAFVVLTLLLVGISFLVRSLLISNQLRDFETDTLHAEVTSAAVAINERGKTGDPVDQTFLASLAGPDTEILWHVPSGRDVVVNGVGFNPSDGIGDDGDLWASADAQDGTVILAVDKHLLRHVVFPPWLTLLLLVLLLAASAAIVGWAMASRLALPFRQLASAAAALGRGRFQLELPRSRLREVTEISSALESSSRQLQERLRRERQLSEHTSHVLRTPLTGLRLELEGLRLADELPEDVHSAVNRSIDRIDQLDGLAGELVALTRHGSLVSGAEISLRDLATACSQRWADELAHHGRTVTAAVEGDLETTYTPGPVEQLLDLLLTDVICVGRGPVRMVYEAAADRHLRLAVSWPDEAPARARTTRAGAFVRARAVAMALGGRLDEGVDGPSVQVRLPRR